MKRNYEFSVFIARLQPFHCAHYKLGEATQLMVRVLPFETNATSCGTYYEIQTKEGKSLANGNYNLSDEEFAAWGQSNGYIDQLVASHVGVTIID